MMYVHTYWCKDNVKSEPFIPFKECCVTCHHLIDLLARVKELLLEKKNKLHIHHIRNRKAEDRYTI